MITVLRSDGVTERAEEARVILPGFEWADVCATQAAGVQGEGWVVTDRRTGTRVCALHPLDPYHPTIDAAIAAAVSILTIYAPTEQAYRAAGARLKALNP